MAVKMVQRRVSSFGGDSGWTEANWCAQFGEMLALQSIYGPEGRFSVLPAIDDDNNVGLSMDKVPTDCDGFSGEINANMVLPEDSVVVELVDKRTNDPIVSRSVKYLLPITLNFRLPKSYPTSAPPRFRLKCQWMTKDQIAKLTDKLTQIWQEESQGEVILFRWTNWLQEECREFLEIKFPLNLSEISQRGSEPLTADALLELLLDYDKYTLDKIFLNGMCNCMVCFDQKIGSLCFRFHRCSHTFCRECLQGFFESQINSGLVKSLICPDANCQQPALPSEVKQILTDERMYSRYETLLLKAALNDMGDVIECPRQKCGNPAVRDSVRKTLGVCMVCRFAFCTYCHRTYHGIAPCLPGNLKLLIEKYNSADEDTRRAMEEQYGKQMLERALEDAQSAMWLMDNASTCPKCGTSIQKISGCNKMTCSVCHIYYCYLCGVTLNSGSPYSHFNETGSTCYNRLFTGGEFED